MFTRGRLLNECKQEGGSDLRGRVEKADRILICGVEVIDTVCFGYEE